MKVISGGQNGVDQSALRAAKACKLETGGWLPKDCITLDGPKPKLLEEFSMREHPLAGYVPRTEMNVFDADATIRIATNFNSPGERCTLRYIKKYNRPHLDITSPDITVSYIAPENLDCINQFSVPIDEVLNFLRENNVKVLNVAGNSERSSPGIGMLSYLYLKELFQHAKDL